MLLAWPSSHFTASSPHLCHLPYRWLWPSITDLTRSRTTAAIYTILKPERPYSQLTISRAFISRISVSSRWHGSLARHLPELSLQEHISSSTGSERDWMESQLLSAAQRWRSPGWHGPLHESLILDLVRPQDFQQYDVLKMHGSTSEMINLHSSYHITTTPGTKSHGTSGFVGSWTDVMVWQGNEVNFIVVKPAVILWWTLTDLVGTLDSSLLTQEVFGGLREHKPSCPVIEYKLAQMRLAQTRKSQIPSVYIVRRYEDTITLYTTLSLHTMCERWKVYWEYKDLTSNPGAWNTATRPSDDYRQQVDHDTINTWLFPATCWKFPFL